MGNKPHVIIGKFEANNSKGSVLFHINPKIFPILVIQKTGDKFRNQAWIAIDGDDEEVLVELKPKSITDLESLGRAFNNTLFDEVREVLHLDAQSDPLIARIRKAVREFLSEQQGKISKHSVVVITALLIGLGLASHDVQLTGASHLCPEGESCSGCAEGCGCEGMDAGCAEGEGEEGGADGDGEGEGSEGGEGGEGEGGCEGCGCGEGF